MRSAILFLLLPLILLGVEKSKIINSETTMTISERGTAILKINKSMLIADKAGEDLAKILISVNDYVRLDKARVRVLDSRGKKKRKYSKRNFNQIDGLSSGSLASGELHYFLDVSNVIPKPFRLELEYTTEISSLFFWPTWSPQEHFPVEQASYLLNVPENFQFYFFNPGGIQGESSKSAPYRWSYSDIEIFPDEVAMPSDVFDKYRIYFVADQFELDGYAGRGSSWEGIGDFYWSLTKDQFHLDTASVRDLKFDACESKRDTIAQIYNYVQEKTRYVAISLGIHGWKPHTSQWVCDNNYGDCKDLSTFFIALLARHGIKANPVLILTEPAGKIYPELPGIRFNHLITCIPLGEDTLWVDCTYDEGTINYLPPADQGCNVLVVDEANSFLTKTPILSSNDNQTISHISVILNSSGLALLSGEIKYIGSASRRLREIFKSQTEKEQRELIVSMFRESAPGFELDEITLLNLDHKNEPLIVQLEGKVPHLGSVSGNRLFTNLSFPSYMGWNGEHPSRRTMPIFAGSPSTYASGITLVFPDNFAIEALPKDFFIETPFGSYQSSYSGNAGKIEANWRFEDYISRIPLEDYPAFYQFRQSVKKASASQLVLTKP